MRKFLNVLLVSMLLLSVTVSNSFGKKRGYSSSYKSKSYSRSYSKPKTSYKKTYSKPKTTYKKTYSKPKTSKYSSTSSKTRTNKYGSTSTSSKSAKTPSKYGSSKTSSTLKKTAVGGAVVGGATAAVASSSSSSTDTSSTTKTDTKTTTPTNKYGSTSTSSTGKYGSTHNTTNSKQTTAKKATLSTYEKKKLLAKQKAQSVKRKKEVLAGNTSYKSYKGYSSDRKPTVTKRGVKTNPYNPRSYTNRSGKTVTIRKVYHYNNATPYGGYYNRYGVGGYYGNGVMDYLPTMMMISMLNNNNSYDAQRYYRERAQDAEMKAWRAEMELAAATNPEVRNTLNKLDNAQRPSDYNDSNYNSRMGEYEQVALQDRINYSEKHGTEIKYDESDKVLENEVIFR